VTTRRLTLTYKERNAPRLAFVRSTAERYKRDFAVKQAIKPINSIAKNAAKVKQTTLFRAFCGLVMGIIFAAKVRKI